MASPGYGKRSAPDQRPPRADDFAHLPAREASIAAYLDRLPEGADISVKTLAKALPDHGQCAVGTVLRIVECTVCGAPGRPDALPGGLCRECRGAPPPRPTGPSAAQVRARVDRLRAAARREPEGGTLRAGTPPARSRPSCA